MQTLNCRVILSCFLISFSFSCHKVEPVALSNSQIENASQSKKSKPNIIFILADDIGYEIPNYTGGQSYSTSNLNFLAANGTQFTQCHSAPLCSPSRFMLLTAKYNFRNYTTWGVLDTSQSTFANLLKKAGYATCIAGKWQFDGGDTSIRKFGFDKYRVSNAYNVQNGDEEQLKFYKDPNIYENGSYWADSLTKGKYGQDLFRDYMFDFIDSNAGKKPFFVYWAMDLCHTPFSPTPDDPQFQTWNSNKPRELKDTIYFPSMVKYMDKLIGELLDKLNSKNLSDNTIILFAGDNGTTVGIHSLWNGHMVNGGKSQTNEAGTHVPLLAYCPGGIKQHNVDTSLISFVDFMATFANIAHVHIPVSYGITDGVSFAPQLIGQQKQLRSWIFCHYVGAGKFEDDPMHLKRWMQNSIYKQYDSLPNTLFSKKFYNIVSDPHEIHPISQQNMTSQEKIISQQFLDDMSDLH